MTPELWALAALALGAALLCFWAFLTGRPVQDKKLGRHAAWGETRPLHWPTREDDPIQPLPQPRWYDEDPWPHSGPHGWGEIRD